MYLRHTLRKKDGKLHRYWRLVRSVRIGASRSAEAHLGQLDAWFRCPGYRQACRVLYGTNRLRCRKCLRLKYQSQYQSSAFWWLDRARKIRRRLGGREPFDGPLPRKPRYMRWRTYRRLERLVSRLEAVGWEAMSAHVYAIRRRTR